jgi:hypothetical protein
MNNPAPLLASTDYDGVVRLWDMRGSVALAAQQAHDGKALCVDWIADNKIVSGKGTAARVFTISSPACC